MNNREIPKSWVVNDPTATTNEDPYMWTSEPFNQSSANDNIDSSENGVETSTQRHIPPLLNTQLQDFEDSSLICPICGDFYKNAVSLRDCYHSFCSECIREYFRNRRLSMYNDLKCPVCNREDTKENDIIKNVAMQTVVGKYLDLRKLLHKSLVDLHQYRCSSSDKIHSNDDVLNDPDVDKPLSSHTMNLRHRTKGKESSIVIQQHSSGNTENNTKHNNHSSKVNLDRPTKVVYKTLTMAQLKNLCSKEGLSTKGQRDELIERHNKFNILLAANLDSINPRSKGEIVAEVETWEFTRKKHSNVTKPTKRDRDSTFSKLIAELKEKNPNNRIGSSAVSSSYDSENDSGLHDEDNVQTKKLKVTHCENEEELNKFTKPPAMASSLKLSSENSRCYNTSPSIELNNSILSTPMTGSYSIKTKSPHDKSTGTLNSKSITDDFSDCKNQDLHVKENRKESIDNLQPFPHSVSINHNSISGTPTTIVNPYIKKNKSPLVHTTTDKSTSTASKCIGNEATNVPTSFNYNRSPTVVSKNDGYWECSKCTYLNKENSWSRTKKTRCDMCQQPKDLECIRIEC